MYVSVFVLCRGAEGFFCVLQDSDNVYVQNLYLKEELFSSLISAQPERCSVGIRVGKWGFITRDEGPRCGEEEAGGSNSR